MRTEFELRIPTARWMLDRGMTPIMEMYSMNNCDMVGVKWDGRNIDRIIAVELKLRNVSAVLRQCEHHKSKANEVWAAMQSCSVRAAERFRGAGVGLLVWDGEKMVERIPAVWREAFVGDWARARASVQRAAWRRRDEYIDRMTRPLMTKY